jgi:hypothetical protein
MDSMFLEEWGSRANVYGYVEGFTNEIYYQKIGNAVFINVNLSGTSNGTVIIFKLPYKIQNLSYINCGARVRDNTSYSNSPGRISNITRETDNDWLSLTKDTAATAWTASGTKDWLGQFIYFTDSRTDNYDMFCPDTSIDWASGAGVTGFSSLARNNFYYYKIGNVVLCRAYFDGTSNATTVTATLPFTPLYNFNNLSAMVTNNGLRVLTMGMVEGTAGSNTVSFFVNGTKTAWTAANNKIWAGWFFYFAE